MTQRQSMSKAESTSLGFRHAVWEMGVFCREAWLVYRLHCREMLVLCVVWISLWKPISTASDALGPYIPLWRIILFSGIAWIILRFTYSMKKMDIKDQINSRKNFRIAMIRGFFYLFSILFIIDYLSLIFLSYAKAIIYASSFVQSVIDDLIYYKVVGSIYIFIFVFLNTIHLLATMALVSVSVFSVIFEGGGVASFLAYLGRRAWWLLPRLVIPAISLYLMSWLFLFHIYLLLLIGILLVIFGGRSFVAEWNGFVGFQNRLVQRVRWILPRALVVLFCFFFLSLVMMYSGQLEDLFSNMEMNIHSPSAIEFLYNIFVVGLFMAGYIGIYMFWIFVLAYVTVIVLCALEQDRHDHGTRTIQAARVASSTT